MRRAIYLTILLSTLVSTGARAEASASTDVSVSAGDDPAPSFERRGWLLLPRPAASSRWQLSYSVLTVPIAWPFHREDSPSTAALMSGYQDFERSRIADSALAGLGDINLRASWPALYQSPERGLSLTLAPGSPCTGACLKVSGSF